MIITLFTKIMGADGHLVYFSKKNPQWFLDLLEANLTTPGNSLPGIAYENYQNDLDLLISCHEEDYVMYYWDTENYPLINDVLSFDEAIIPEFQKDFVKWNIGNYYQFDKPNDWFLEYIRDKIDIDDQIWT